MSFDRDDYERLVSAMTANLQASRRNICDLGYGKNNTLRGKSGQDHQLDVSFIDRDFVRPTLVLVECKYYDKPLDLDQVKAVLATQLDILINVQAYLDVIAIIVSASGIDSEAARDFAGYYGITLEVAGQSENYSFHYENIIQKGPTDPAHFRDVLEPFIQRRDLN